MLMFSSFSLGSRAMAKCVRVSHAPAGYVFRQPASATVPLGMLPGNGMAPSMDLKVTLSDLSKSVTRFCKTSLEKCVWSFGDELGMRKLTTSAQSKGGYIFRHHGRSWRSQEHPKLTLAEAKVCSGDAVEFLGDFEAFGEQAAPAMAIEVEVRFRDKAKTWTELAKVPVDQSVWRLGEDLGMRKLTTSFLPRFGTRSACG